MEEESPSFPLERLLPELQLLVWESALPARRVFHVRETYTTHPNQPSLSRSHFRLHIHHKPPAILSVCRAARAAALSQGVFLDGTHGGFFVPASDVLYFDRNQRRSLRASSFSDNDATWSAIQHVGLEWRAFFSRTPRLRPGEDASSMWREALRPLRACMPRLRTVTYVLPMVRHAGGLSWGREPYGAARFEAALVALPDDTHVPWGDALVLDSASGSSSRRAGNRAQQGVAELMDGKRSCLLPWGDMKQVIDGSLNIKEEEEEQVDGDWRERVEMDRKVEWPKLDLTGCWLLRVNATYDEDVISFSN